nr:hypothetical protein [Tanacetum cinerariifolium]
IRDVGYGIKDTWIDPAEAVPAIAPTTTAMAKLRDTDRKRQVQLTETLRVIRDMKQEMSDMQKELISQREQLRRERQPGPDA